MRPGMTVFEGTSLHKSPICDGTWNLHSGEAFSARPKGLGLWWKGQSARRNQMSSGKIAVAAVAFASVTLLSFGWSAQHGVSLSVAGAQAKESREMTSKQHVARHSTRVAPRHQARMARTYGDRRMARPYYGPNPVQAGANVAAGAVNTAGAVAAGAIGTAGAIAAAPFGQGPYAMAPGYEGPYYASSAWGDYECRPGVGPYECRPYAAKDWYHH
jgi:hypothetical protein